MKNNQNNLESIRETDSLIYLTDIENVENIPEQYCKIYFPNRYEKALSYHFRDDRNRCICAGVLLHEILQLEETDIRYNEYGKPFTDSNCSFSLSHSGKYVVLAVRAALVGVDIEQTERDYLDIMPYVFSKEEISYVGKDKTRFYVLWTLKESLSKAAGVGLSRSMTDISVLPLLQGDNIFWLGKLWYGTAQTIDDGQYILSCVSEAKGNCTVRRYSL